MSDFIPDLEAGFVRLTGTANYIRWARGFETIAKLKGVWSLITGEERILGESYLYGCHPKECHLDLLRESCKSCFRHTQLYTAQNVRVQTALGLLEFWVEPDIRYEIHSITYPRTAWLFPEDHYKMGNTAASMYAEEAMKKLRLRDCKNMADYLCKHNLLRVDIQDAGTMFTDHELATYIMRGLSEPYGLGDDADYLVRLAEQGILKILAARLLWLEKSYTERRIIPAQSTS